jgi:formyl-CoA transferase
VPCGPIYAIDEMFADPQVRHLGVTARVTSPHLGELEMLAQPVRLSRTPSRVERHPPALGEHTEEVLRELGCSAEEIAELSRRG